MDKLYFVSIVVPEELDKRIQLLKLELSERYRTKAALKAPAHITLYTPFHFHPEKEELLFSAMKESVQDSDDFNISLTDFSCFPPRVIFIAVNSNHELNVLQNQVKDKFMHVDGMKHRKAQEFHPHMTIANRDWTEEQFYEAWSDFSQRSFNAEFRAQKISLLRLDEGRWNCINESHLG